MTRSLSFASISLLVLCAAAHAATTCDPRAFGAPAQRGLRLLRQAFPIVHDADDPSLPRYLDARDLNVPSVGLAAAERETLRLGDMVLIMLEETKILFEKDDAIRLIRSGTRTGVSARSGGRAGAGP